MSTQVTALLLCACVAAACGGTTEGNGHEAPPATVAHPVPESQMGSVQLTDDAVERLGIETSTVAEHERPGAVQLGGEVSIPANRVQTLAAPVAGVIEKAKAVVPGTIVAKGAPLFRLVPLAPADRDTTARARREVSAARAQLTAAQSRLDRTKSLAEQEAGSQRAVEEATAARDVAKADVAAARARAATLSAAPLLSDVAMTIRAPEAGVVRLVSVTEGQAVAASAPLVELVATDQLWIRVAVPSGDIRRLDPAADARVRGLASGSTELPAKPLAGPPTSNPMTGTVDRYFALTADASPFAPGERVLVTLPLREQTSVRALPWSSVFYDASGSAWVYTCEPDHRYRRRRVDVVRRAGELAVIARGPALGSCVVSVGTAELYGTEFEVGH